MLLLTSEGHSCRVGIANESAVDGVFCMANEKTKTRLAFERLNSHGHDGFVDETNKESLLLCDPGAKERAPFSAVQSSNANQNPRAERGSV